VTDSEVGYLMKLRCWSHALIFLLANFGHELKRVAKSLKVHHLLSASSQSCIFSAGSPPNDKEVSLAFLEPWMLINFFTCCRESASDRIKNVSPTEVVSERLLTLVKITIH
jgi:hypothetical protein